MRQESEEVRAVRAIRGVVRDPLVSGEGMNAEEDTSQNSHPFQDVLIHAIPDMSFPPASFEA